MQNAYQWPVDAYFKVGNDRKPHWILTEERRKELVEIHQHIPPIPSSGTMYYSWDRLGGMITRWVVGERSITQIPPEPDKPVSDAFLKALKKRREEYAK